MQKVGLNKDAIGCEVCKPTIGSVLASLWNEHIMNPVHHRSVVILHLDYYILTLNSNQDTNDRYVPTRNPPLKFLKFMTSRFMANIQRNGMTQTSLPSLCVSIHLDQGRFPLSLAWLLERSGREQRSPCRPRLTSFLRLHLTSSLSSAKLLRNVGQSLSQLHSNF